MSLILKNRTLFNSLYELDPTCFTKQNTALVALNNTYPNVANYVDGDGNVQNIKVAPIGVLGGSVAALKEGASYTVVPADGTNQPIGLFVNNALGNPFDNAPAAASNKIAIAHKMASVEVDVYEDDEFEIGDKLYASANGYLTKTAGSNDTVIGIVTKLPTVSDPFLGLEMTI